MGATSRQAAGKLEASVTESKAARLADEVKALSRLQNQAAEIANPAAPASAATVARPAASVQAR